MGGEERKSDQRLTSWNADVDSSEVDCSGYLYAGIFIPAGGPTSLTLLKPDPKNPQNFVPSNLVLALAEGQFNQPTSDERAKFFGARRVKFRAIAPYSGDAYVDLCT